MRKREAANGSKDKLIARTHIGTGGTISGVGQFLKSVNEDVRVVLADPEGSGLYNKVRWSARTDLDEFARGTIESPRWPSAVLDPFHGRGEELNYRLQIRVGCNVFVFISPLLTSTIAVAATHQPTRSEPPPLLGS
jgi:hypothetical protein